MILSRVRALLLAFLFTVTAVTVTATSVRTVNLTEMVGFSDRIFLGRCLSAETRVQEGTGFRVKVYHFRVVEGLKGVTDSQSLTVRQILGTGRGFARIAGLPDYRKGQVVLLFLHPDSRLGLTSPVGMTQGTFHRVENGDGESYFVNGVRNANLGYQVGVETLSADGLNSSEVNQLRAARPISLESLRAMVEKIDRYQRDRKEEAVR